MLNHYLAVGGNEVINSARSYAYTQGEDCAVQWLEDPECDAISASLGDVEYVAADIASAPWYDPDDPDVTTRFFGLYGIDIRGLSDSTAEADIVPRNGDGAVVGGYRHGAREVRVRAWLTARGMDALEAGHTWLRNVLEPNACGVHGGGCGQTDAGFFVDCPPDPATITKRETVWSPPIVNYVTNPSFETAAIPAGAQRSTEWSARGTYSLFIPFVGYGNGPYGHTPYGH